MKVQNIETIVILQIALCIVIYVNFRYIHCIFILPISAVQCIKDSQEKCKDIAVPQIQDTHTQTKTQKQTQTFFFKVCHCLTRSSSLNTLTLEQTPLSLSDENIWIMVGRDNLD